MKNAFFENHQTNISWIPRPQICFTQLSSGGGIIVSGGTLALANTRVNQNAAVQTGGGLAVTGGAVTAVGVALTANAAVGGSSELFVDSGSFDATGLTLAGASSPTPATSSSPVLRLPQKRK